MSTFGEKIKEIRNFYGYTQEKFAYYTGISVKTIRKYEQESDQNTTPDIKTVKKLADYFGLTTDSLIYDNYKITTKETLKESISTIGISIKSIENLKKSTECADIFLSSNYYVNYREKMELLLHVIEIFTIIQNILNYGEDMIDIKILKDLIYKFNILSANEFFKYFCNCGSQIKSITKKLNDEKNKNISLDNGILGDLKYINKVLIYTIKHLKNELSCDFNNFLNSIEPNTNKIDVE